MSEETTTEVAVDSSKASVKKTPVKKVPAKASAPTKKTPAKKTAPVKAAAKKTAAPKEKKERAPREKKEGLRNPQVRILQFLAKSGSAKTRKEIAEGAPADLAMLNSYIGSDNEEVRVKCDADNFPSLLTLKHVKSDEEENPEGGRARKVYTITAVGKKALESALKSAAKKE
jgi:hypothetical protein